MSEPMLLTVEDVQNVIQLGRTKVYEMIRTGELPVIRIGRSVRVRREALERWLNELEEQNSDEYLLR